MQWALFYSCFTLKLVHVLFDLILCRHPNPDAVVVVRTPLGVFAARSLLQNQQECFRGSRLVSSSKKIELLELSSSETNEIEPLSAARCRIFKRLNYNVIYLKTLNLSWHIFCILLGMFLIFIFQGFSPILHLSWLIFVLCSFTLVFVISCQITERLPIFHLPKGPRHHSLDAINNLSMYKVQYSSFISI